MYFTIVQKVVNIFDKNGLHVAMPICFQIPRESSMMDVRKRCREKLGQAGSHFAIHSFPCSSPFFQSMCYSSLGCQHELCSTTEHYTPNSKTGNQVVRQICISKALGSLVIGNNSLFDKFNLQPQIIFFQRGHYVGDGFIGV